MKKRDLVLGMLQILAEQQPQRSNPFYLCKRFEPSIHVSFCCGILLTVVLPMWSLSWVSNRISLSPLFMAKKIQDCDQLQAS